MKAAWVVDCSVAMTWLFADEATPQTAELLDRFITEKAVVPAWWFLEITNVMALAERKNRITPAQSAEFISDLSALEIEIDTDTPDRAFSHLLPLCRAHGLTSYDAVYLDLAVRQRLPLATLDEPLRTAARQLDVTLLGR
jgi:predicted nucleic acid-binding protein